MIGDNTLLLAGPEIWLLETGHIRLLKWTGLGSTLQDAISLL